MSLLLVLQCTAALAQDTKKDFVIAARRAGVVELLDPQTLETVSRIDLGLTPLNRIWASADGTMLYVDGPTAALGPGEPVGCCSLYEVDLATVKSRMVASGPGGRSRRAWFFHEGVAYPADRPIQESNPAAPQDQLWVNPRGVPAGALNDLDELFVRAVREELTRKGFGAEWRSSAAKSGNRFLFYATRENGEGRLWALTADIREIGDGVPIAPFARVQACRRADPLAVGLIESLGDLILYERFGGHVDRHADCGEVVPGGAWKVNLETGEIVGRLAADLHFWEMIRDPAGATLYGLEEGPVSGKPPKLARIDAQSGEVLEVRLLDPDYWHVAIAPLRTDLIPGLAAKAVPGQ